MPSASRCGRPTTTGTSFPSSPPRRHRHVQGARQHEALVDMGDPIHVGTPTLKDPLLCTLTLPRMSVCFFPATNAFAGSSRFAPSASFPASPSWWITTSSTTPVPRSVSPATTSKIMRASRMPDGVPYAAPGRWYRHWYWSVSSHLRHRGVMPDPDDVPHVSLRVGNAPTTLLLYIQVPRTKETIDAPNFTSFIAEESARIHEVKAAKRRRKPRVKSNSSRPGTVALTREATMSSVSSACVNHTSYALDG